jgi:hypothetical protein
VSGRPSTAAEADVDLAAFQGSQISGWCSHDERAAIGAVSFD